jgi:hypothetical protein
VPKMLVADLNHFLDLPDEVPGPARRLAAHLGGIVRAATAGDAGHAWVSALPCARRPGHRACPGRMILRRSEPPSAIHWRCSGCDDEGVISAWEHSPYDLRRPTPTVTGLVREITTTEPVAAALRDLQLLDTDSARVVYGIRVDGTRLILTATDDELDELTGQLAAEANREPNRRRRQRLHAAFDALTDARSAGLT